MMKPSKTQLYDAMGELIYAVAKSEGFAEAEPSTLLIELLAGQAWANEVQLSFNYEYQNENTMEEAYEKAVDVCKAYGPAEEYAFLFQALEVLGRHTLKGKPEQPSILSRFQNDLTTHFMAMDFQQG